MGMGKREGLHGSTKWGKKKEEKYLGVIIHDMLTPEREINEIFTSTYHMVTNIRVAINYMDKSMMKKIITMMIRPKFKYKVGARNKGPPYEDRLQEMEVTTFEDRQERGGLITM